MSTNPAFYVLRDDVPGDPDGAETDFYKALDPETGTIRTGEAPTCPRCGKTIGLLSWRPPYEGELECWGKRFGDVIPTGDDLLVSDRFKALYEEHGFTGLSGFDPVRILRVKRRSRLRGAPPAYYRVSVVRSRAAVDHAASGFAWDTPPTCDECRHGQMTRWKRIVIEPGTWSGEDIFIPRGLSEFMTTERFAEFCRSYRIANARLIPADQYCIDMEPWKNDEKAQELMSAEPGEDLLEVHYSDGRILRYQKSSRYYVTLDRHGRLCQVGRHGGPFYRPEPGEVEKLLQNPHPCLWEKNDTYPKTRR